MTSKGSFRSIRVRRLTDDDAEEIASWRYPGRYSTYDVMQKPGPDEGYWAVEGDGELIGYCCIGFEARVPGVGAEEGAIDIGYGMHPDLMGRGLGQDFVAAILEFVAGKFAEPQQRLLILDWNDRSRKVAEKLGFRQTDVVPSGEGRFLVMVRPTPR